MNGMNMNGIIASLKKNWIAVSLAVLLGFVLLIWPVGILIPDGAPADDLGMSLFKDKAGITTDDQGRLTNGKHTATFNEQAGRYVLVNTTKLAIAEGVKPQATANATTPANSTASTNSTTTPSKDNSKLGDNNNVVVAAGFPTTLDELTSFINSCPSVEDEEFNDAWDGSSIESSASEIKVLPEGSTDAIASLVEQYGTTKVWKAIQDADVSTAFLWKSDGYADQIRTAEQAADKPYSLDFEYYQVDSDGSKDDVNGQMDEDGTLYAADYNFK